MLKTAQDRAENRNKFTIQLLFQNDHNFPINKSNELPRLRSTLRIVARRNLWECNERRPFWGQLQHWLRLQRFGMCVFSKLPMLVSLHIWSLVLCPKAKQKIGRGSPICPKKDDYLQLPMTYTCKHIRLIETLLLQGNYNKWHCFHMWTLYLSKVTVNSETWGVRSGLVMSGVRSGALTSSDVVCEVEW